MPRPKTDTDSAFDVAFQFMLEKEGPRPGDEMLDAMQSRIIWDQSLSLATDVIAYDRQRQGKETP